MSAVLAALAVAALAVAAFAAAVVAAAVAPPVAFAELVAAAAVAVAVAAGAFRPELPDLCLPGRSSCRTYCLKGLSRRNSCKTYLFLLIYPIPKWRLRHQILSRAHTLRYALQLL